MGSSYYYTNPETGYVTNKHEYTTWGNNTKAPTYNYDPEYRASEPYFTGHPYDGSLNLYYAEARFYDPETGSFLSSDPAKSGLNWYQYCGSNRTTYVDVLGLLPTTIQEDDPFFFAKMQNSGTHGRVDFELLKKIDALSYDELYAKRGENNLFSRLTEKKLLSAKYLMFFMLNDPVFAENMGGNKEILLNKLIAGALANLVIEGNMGGLENPNYVNKAMPPYLLYSVYYYVAPSKYGLEEDTDIIYGYKY